MMFESVYEAWLTKQIRESTGERKRRLKAHGHAEKLFLEKVWWPAVGRLDGLHAEYEISDFRDGSRFLDYAYLQPPFRTKVDLEIDGFTVHARDADRRSFSDSLARQNSLVLDDWKVLRFSYDDIRDRPRQCQQVIHQIMGRWFTQPSGSALALPVSLREIIRSASLMDRVIVPADVREWIGVSDRTARILLKQLSERGHLVPASGSQRIRSYRLHHSAIMRDL